MAAITSCPTCSLQVSLPEGADESAWVRCPRCGAEYQLRAALEYAPPMLELIPEPVMPAEGRLPAWAAMAGGLVGTSAGTASATPLPQSTTTVSTSNGTQVAEGADEEVITFDDSLLLDDPTTEIKLDQPGQRDLDESSIQLGEEGSPDDQGAKIAAAAGEAAPNAGDDFFNFMAEDAKPASRGTDGEEEAGTVNVFDDDELRLAPRDDAEPERVAAVSAAVTEAPAIGMPRRRKRAANPIVLLVGIVGGGVVGLAIGYAILMWGFGRDPFGFAYSMPEYLVPPSLRPPTFRVAASPSTTAQVDDSSADTTDDPASHDPTDTGLPAFNEAAPGSARGLAQDELPVTKGPSDSDTDKSGAEKAPTPDVFDMPPDVAKEPVEKEGDVLVPAPAGTTPELKIDPFGDAASPDAMKKDATPDETPPVDPFGDVPTSKDDTSKEISEPDASKETPKQEAIDPTISDAPSAVPVDPFTPDSPAPMKDDAAKDDTPTKDTKDQAEPAGTAETKKPESDPASLPDPFAPLPTEEKSDAAKAGATKTGPVEEPVAAIRPQAEETYTVADLARDVEAARQTTAAALAVPENAPQPEKNRVNGPYYRNLAKMAQSVSFLEPEQSPEQEKALAAAVEAVTAAVPSPAKLEELGKLAGYWFTATSRKENGIVLAGVVKQSRELGQLVESEVELLGRPLTLTVVSAKKLPANEGESVIVIGSIINEPAKNIPGYEGAAERVVWAAASVEPPQ